MTTKPTDTPALADALRDAIAFMRGEISGPAQRDGIIREADAALREAPPTPAPSAEAGVDYAECWHGCDDPECPYIHDRAPPPPSPTESFMAGYDAAQPKLRSPFPTSPENVIEEAVRETIDTLGIQAVRDLSWFPSSREPTSPASVEAVEQVLAKHWLTDLCCSHEGEGSNKAVCWCGWAGERVESVGKAVNQWAAHVAQTLAVLHPTSPTVAFESFDSEVYPNRRNTEGEAK